MSQRQQDFLTGLIYGLIGGVLFVELLFVFLTPATATTPSAWSPLPAEVFRSFDAPGSGGHSVPDAVSSQRPSGTPLVGAGSHPTTPRSIPTGHVVPPFVAIKGVATYYAYHRGQAAAARALRAALGPNWRGMVVTVTGPLGAITVRLTDYESSLIPGRVIDLDERDWAAICGDPARGVCRVTVSRG